MFYNQFCLLVETLDDMKIHSLQSRLQNKERILMDGAMGTEILRRDSNTTLPLWSAEALLNNPKIIQQIHEDYIKAGAEIIITDTFRTTKRAFGKKRIAQKAKSATTLACRLAQAAIKRTKPNHTIYIAGSIAPLEDCYLPELTPPEKDLKREHLEYVKDLKAGGIDFLLIETMITLRETKAAVNAAKELAMPFAVSFCTNQKSDLLGGESLQEVIAIIERYDPLFIGVNCVSPESAARTLKKLKKITKYPISVYAQGDGIPNDDQGWEFIEEKNMKKYVKFAKEWINEGAQIIGGCCGTTPDYIEKIRKFL